MLLSIKYHKIFDFDLVRDDYPRWRYVSDKSITGITGTKSTIRIKREKISKRKLIIAKKASNILTKIPTVKFVGVTGSLAMMNSKENSDIDLMIITKNNTLWSTRLVVLVILSMLHIPFRRARNSEEANKLCLNMWIDETDLIWDKKDRSIYTAHEIAQIVPLVNKNKTYEKFLYLNRWVLDYWPYSVKIKNLKLNWSHLRDKNYKLKIKNSNIFEKICHWFQYKYMKSKITREVITPTRAIFHPNDWGKIVMKKLKIYN